jgi:hypothetical protein
MIYMIYYIVVNLLDWLFFRLSMFFLSPDASSKGTIEMGVICASILNWFQDDILRTKSWIEARCGMYVYLMNI